MRKILQAIQVLFLFVLLLGLLYGSGISYGSNHPEQKDVSDTPLLLEILAGSVLGFLIFALIDFGYGHGMKAPKDESESQLTNKQ